VGPRGGLDTVVRRENLSPYWESKPGRPAHCLISALTELPRLYE